MKKTEKELMKISGQEIILVEWFDTVRNNRWHTLEETKQWCRSVNWLVYDVGLLIEETKDYIVIASAVTPENESTDLQFNGLTKIPKGWVRTIKRFKI